jgi:hypothetical protein
MAKELLMANNKPTVGDVVIWSNGKKPLGRIIHTFTNRGSTYAVVEHLETWALKVVRVYDKLLVLSTPVDEADWARERREQQ